MQQNATRYPHPQTPSPIKREGAYAQHIRGFSPLPSFWGCFAIEMAKGLRRVDTGGRGWGLAAQVSHHLLAFTKGTEILYWTRGIHIHYHDIPN